MHGIGPGSVLAERYTAQRRLAQLRGAERWSAQDQTLEREVELLCFPATHEHAEAGVDAARRAAGLDNPRLVRVLDVGVSEGLAYVVEESLHGAHTLGSLLAQGGLPAEEVRRLVGETATALDSASQRGLHHLMLSPSQVLRTQDGSVKVAGLAVAAALAGSDDVESAEASRIDAVGAVALAYAGLTSRWPLDTDSAGLERAPRVVGGVPAPSEIAAGVPSDLDALCRLTLNRNQGPVSPGDFAAQIAPWSLTQIGRMVQKTPAPAPAPRFGLPSRIQAPSPAPAEPAGARAPASQAADNDATGQPTAVQPTAVQPTATPPPAVQPTAAQPTAIPQPAAESAREHGTSAGAGTTKPSPVSPGGPRGQRPDDSTPPARYAEEPTVAHHAVRPTTPMPPQKTIQPPAAAMEVPPASALAPEAETTETRRATAPASSRPSEATGTTEAAATTPMEQVPQAEPHGTNEAAPGAATAEDDSSREAPSPDGSGTAPTEVMTAVHPTATPPTTTAGPPADSATKVTEPDPERSGPAPTAEAAPAEPVAPPTSRKGGAEPSGDRAESGSSPAGAKTEQFRWPTWVDPSGAAGKEDEAPQEASAVGTTAAAVAGAVGSALDAAGQAAGAVSDRVGIFAKAAAERAAERRAYRQAEEEEAERHRISIDQALLGANEDLEPPLPMLPAETAAAPTRGQSKLALMIVAAFVVVALLVGVFGASRIGSNTDVGLPAVPSTTRTVAVTAPATTVTVSPSQGTSEDSPDGKLAFLSASGFDPQGDGQERNGEAGRVWDGKTDTYWSSEGYRTADMGGLKDGAGVILDFGQTVKPSDVTLTLPDPSTFDLYLAPDRSLDGATKVGSSSDKSGEITIRVTGGKSGQYLIVWFTRVSRVSDGAYRATLAEVTAKG